MTLYTGHHLYKLLTALCVVLAMLFVWQLYQRWDWGALLFLGVSIWSAARCAILMSSKVATDEDRVRVLKAGAAPREIEYRQLSAVYEEGRGLKSILLLYHPRNATGLIDPNEEIALHLPAVNDHDALLAALNEKMPA